MVVYQVYPRSFADSDGDGHGDLRGLIGRLDHLRWLGVDAVWLSPIHPSPMKDGGYDVSDFRGVDPRFGTVADVGELAAGLHERGMKLLLDVVACHTSIEHPWFRDHPERYVWSPTDEVPNNWRSVFGGPAWSADPHGRGTYLHSFLPEQPDLDWRHPDVAREMGDVLRFWRAQGVDGFRLDALQQLTKDPRLRDDPPATAPAPFPTHPDWASLEHLRSSDQGDNTAALAALRQAAGADAHVVGEVFLPAARRARYLQHLDAAFCFELMFARWDAEALREAIVAGLSHPGPAWVLSNHDFPRLPDRIGAENVRAAALLLLSLPGDVFLYAGDELAVADGPGRPRGVALAAPYDRTGRDPCRHPVPWEQSGPGHGFTSGTPWLEVVLPPGGAVDVQRGDPTSQLQLTKRLIAARARIEGPLEDLRVDDGVLSFRRGEHAIAVNATSGPRPMPRGTVVVATHAPQDGALRPGAGVLVTTV